MAGEEAKVGILGTIINAVKKLFKTLGIAEEKAERYAKLVVYGVLAVLALIIVSKIFRFLRPPRRY